MTPNELAADDKILTGFSPLDVRTITYFACKKHLENNSPRPSQVKQNFLFRIISMTFSRRQKKQMFLIEQSDKSEVIGVSTVFFICLFGILSRYKVETIYALN
jgi:hypothetical protein